MILLCVFGVQSSQNGAIALEEQVNTAYSDIKVQEKRRVDLVYNLADCVKQYDKHEAETLTAIVDGRGSSGDIENVTTAIAAVIVIVVGIFGGIVGPFVLNKLNIDSKIARGLSLGAAAHGLGTARAMELGALEGAISGLAIGLMGVTTAILVPVVEWVMSLF